MSALLLAGGHALADPTTIVRVRSANPALDRRLDAELTALGFVVKGVEADDPRLDLESIARANGAASAVRVDAGNVVEVWAEPRRRGDPPLHDAVAIDASRGYSVATVGAVESLRAHLLEVRVDAPPPPVLRAPAALPPAPPASAPPSSAAPPLPGSAPAPRPRLWLQLAAGVDASPGGLAPGAQVLVAGRFEPRPWVSLGVFGAITPLQTALEAPPGRALVRHAIAGAAVDGQGHLGKTTLAAGAGAALVGIFIEGTSPAAGYAARDASTLGVAPVLRASASTELAATVRLRAEATAGVTFPEATITFADQPRATWGRPFALFTLGIEWGAMK